MLKIISVLIVCLLPSISQAFHPGEEDNIVNIGVGSTLKLLKDVNLLPNQRSSFFKESKYREIGKCLFFVNEVVNYDRVIQKATSYVISRVWRHDASPHYFFKIDSTALTYIQCAFKNDSYATIGNFRKIAGEVMELSFATPVIVK